MGTIQIDGSTPKLTIGNATAEDATILYDGNAKDFYIALDDSADKLVIGEGSTVGTNSILTITDDSVTVGDAAAVDTKIVFDGNAQDYHIGLDDSADTLVLGLGSTLGTTPAMTVNSSQVVTFAQNPVFPDGGVAVADLDIDGATDIGAAIVDADLFIVDDGAGGTNRKTTASRLKTYVGGGKVLQIVQATSTSTVSSTSNASWTDTTLTCNITPQTDSDVLALITHSGLHVSSDGVDIALRLLRGASEIFMISEFLMEGVSTMNLTTSSHYLDGGPGGDGSTAITYHTEFKISDDAGTIKVNNGSYGTSVLTLIEIGA